LGGNDLLEAASLPRHDSVDETALRWKADIPGRRPFKEPNPQPEGNAIVDFASFSLKIRVLVRPSLVRSEAPWIYA
jgi:hypothetical protein